MSYTTWLFLYLAGLMELDIRYRLTTHHLPATLIALLPLAALALPLRARPAWRWPAVTLTLCCAVLMARGLSLDFWNTERIDLALLSAGIGLGGLLVVRAEPRAPTGRGRCRPPALSVATVPALQPGPSRSTGPGVTTNPPAIRRRSPASWRAPRPAPWVRRAPPAGRRDRCLPRAGRDRCVQCSRNPGSARAPSESSSTA